MPTTARMITNEWVQITDGTKDEIIQFRGEVAVCNSQDKPPPDAPALVFENQTLMITSGETAWFRAQSPDSQIILVIW